MATFILMQCALDTDGIKYKSKLNYEDARDLGLKVLEAELKSRKQSNDKEKIEYFTNTIKEYNKL